MKKKNLNAKKKIHKLVLEYLNNQKILKIYKEFSNSLENTSRFAVAVSGGPDSLALAFLAKCFSLRNNLLLKYYIVDHQLRKNSLSEAKLVSSKLKKIGIECKILTWSGRKPQTNIQAIARNKRYSLLINQCKKNKINYLLLGHHVDDLYENFLIRLLRGSGLKGLTSFGKTSEFKSDEIKILRPLINLDKKELIYLSNKVFNFFVKDSSNLNENFKRVRIRNLINQLEKEGLDKKKLKLTISNLKDSDSSINFYIKKNIENNTRFFKSKNVYLLNNYFFDQADEVIFRSLSFILKSVGKKNYAARGKSIKDLIFRIRSNSISKATLGGCYVEKINKTILISRERSFKT